MNNQFTKKELQVILDVVNVYDPNDIAHVYPEMGTPEFMQEVSRIFQKTLSLLDRDQIKTKSGELTDQEIIEAVREANYS